MVSYKNLKIVGGLLAMAILGCTKLHEGLRSTLTSSQTSSALGAQRTQLLLQSAYTDMGTPFCGDQGQVLSLEENSSDTIFLWCLQEVVTGTIMALGV
ncbi:MAG: hypothetical protein E6H06_09525 [Bacteroidetes bacterium]|nr:MAG: hypothetical protein E6H06_09525 [Bacteroidota bacterium]